MKQLVCVVLLSLWSAGLFAQGDDRQAQALERAEQVLAQAQEKLDLSDEQMASIRPVLLTDAERRMEVVLKYATDKNGERKKPSRKDRPAMRDEILVINEDTHRALAEVMSDEQLAAFRDLQNERRAAMMEEARKRNQ